jgi:ribonuclease P protein component
MPAAVLNFMCLEKCRETDLSTEQACPQAPPRLSRPHGNQGGPSGPQAPSRQGPQAPVSLTGQAAHGMPETRISLERLKKRGDFLRLRRGKSAAMPGLVLQMDATPAEFQAEGTARVGFTVTRKIGNAVTRNRARRRLKAAAARILPLEARSGRDYVLIGRAATIDRPFVLLCQDLSRALGRVEKAGGTTRPEPHP